MTTRSFDATNPFFLRFRFLIISPVSYSTLSHFASASPGPFHIIPPRMTADGERGRVKSIYHTDILRGMITHFNGLKCSYFFFHTCIDEKKKKKKERERERSESNVDLFQDYKKCCALLSEQ
jgi:hypothetical protein